MGEEEQATTDSTEGVQETRKTMPTRTKNDDGSEDDKETGDKEDKLHCIHLQSRSRQVPLLPNTGPFQLQKKYQLVKHLMISEACPLPTMLGARTH
jgi:hypothetical protein